eukprot:CAMPEP_0176494668 /NCGR_PEP_ID=MMETSP0200_2-20121128/10232_1 /TAXON_ID=947934 /ORGANISM="Chaetoceros sp., Strain GSL56" /LENGTH=804 /DNA_ID=CAMNT_0017892467 /DNA_START=3205 /DNA_END=5616 /DNA_ORIENTATION=+
MKGSGATLSILFLFGAVPSAKVTTIIEAFVLPSFTSTAQTASTLKSRTGKSCPFHSCTHFPIVSDTNVFNSHNAASGPTRELLSRQSFQLYAKKENDDDDHIGKDKRRTEQKAVSVPIAQRIVMIWKVLSTRVLNFLPTLRVAIASFTVGAVFALTVVFVPVYNSVDKMSEPVTLFETILTDLDQGYVDDVDTRKLFETGVSAMLKSLDPYTEFEGKQEASDLNESVTGKYGGIGLVISGTNIPPKPSMSSSIKSITSDKVNNNKILPNEAMNDNMRLLDDDTIALDDDDDDDGDLLEGFGMSSQALSQKRRDEQKAYEKAVERGIRVVNAFEGYAFDYGMRPGDKILAVDGWRIEPGTPVEDVRNRLRGEPGSNVEITFLRDGVEGENKVTIPRTVVQIADVKLATMIGDAKDGIGYIQLSGFSSDAGREVRNAIFALQQVAENASNGKQSLQGLILDLRGNPGGLLTSAVDVSSLLVPKGSEIVSAKGRGFPGITYKSRVDPILDPNTKLAVLVNESTASAAEIVSGAVQDLDVGVIVGSGRTFGKGLVQNVESLPFDTALKFTVAKYYTPSGRCIQSTNYSNGGSADGKYKASKVAEKDKATFYTKNGREVKDGGGVSVDYKVEAPKASALEVTLLRSGIISDFAAEWCKTHELTNNFAVDEKLYRDFQQFVMKQVKDGDLKLDSIYRGPINELKMSLERSGYTASAKELQQLQSNIMQEMSKDFEKYKNDIKEDVATGILARYLPESMLIDRSIQTDKQVLGALQILRNQNQFNKLLARNEMTTQEGSSNHVIASSDRIV